MKVHVQLTMTLNQLIQYLYTFMDLQFPVLRGQ